MRDDLWNRRLPGRVIRFGIFKVREYFFNLFYGVKTMSDLQYLTCEDGLRVIPFVTHDRVQCNRHCSRYEFARQLIEKDAADKPVSILDLGCGSGHGSKTLSAIPNSSIYGIDISPYAIKYAIQTYGTPNIVFGVADINEYIKTMPEFDYIVSHHVIEHLKEGLGVVNQLKFSKMAIIATPYNEVPGTNQKHVLPYITEKSFNGAYNKVFYYDDYWGKIHSEKPKNIFYSLICVMGKGVK